MSTETLDVELCNETMGKLPALLVENIEVEAELADRIRDNIRARADAFPALSLESQRILSAMSSIRRLLSDRPTVASSGKA